MYANAPNNARQLALLKQLRMMLKGIVPAQKVQPRTLRAFSPLRNDNSNAVFNFGDGVKVLANETLLRDSRIFVGNVLGIGIAQVPVFGYQAATGTSPEVPGKNAPGNMEVISYPHPDMFIGMPTAAATAAGTPPSVNEYQSIKMFFNGLMSFKTDQETRLENLPMSRFTICTQTGIFLQKVLHPIDIQTTLILEGGLDNTLTVNFLDGKYGAIEGTANHHVNFGISELAGFEIICDKSQVAAVRAALKS